MAEKRAVSFFEQQENARRATRRLVLWFTFGVAGTAAAIFAVIRIALTAGNVGNVTSLFFPEWLDGRGNGNLWADPLLMLAVFAGTLLVVGGASLLKSIEFSDASGADVAQQLGGRRISPDTREPSETRLRNVVQEMSIASGVPVPEIFVLDGENSINAFAAGTRTENAAVAVSRGALEKLSRDELQAVVGHEFSHILNGDMRLNMRLCGWIFGLMMISLAGNILFRAGLMQPRSRSREKNNSGGIVILIGVGFIVIGFISQIFAQIIQAAVSRSRERLADASATQFTRNPLALANALARIGGEADGSRISSPGAGEFAHLFFADAVGSIFATHPPLEERIRALNPNWDGKFLPPLSRSERAAEREESAPRGGNPAVAGTDLRRLRNLAETNSVPAFLSEMSRTADDAKALIYLLIMTDSPAVNVEQAKILHAREKSSVFKKMENLWARMRNFPREKRISGALIAAPALRELSARERREFCETLERLAQTDGNVSLYEFCILSAVRGLLVFDGQENFSSSDVVPEAELALNLFLRNNDTPRAQWQNDFSAAFSRQSMFPRSLRVLDDSALTVPALDAAFRKLRASSIRTRECLLDTAAALAASDGKTTDDEADLLRALAVALDAPVPAANFN